MEGGTEFVFVTGGIAEAVASAREVAGDSLRVAVAGGASVVRQAMQAGLLDELHLHVAPVLLGSGERLFDGVSGVELESLSVTGSPGAAHLSYRIVH
jgi:dihydrofolate reductase